MELEIPWILWFSVFLDGVTHAKITFSAQIELLCAIMLTIIRHFNSHFMGIIVTLQKEKRKTQSVTL